MKCVGCTSLHKRGSLMDYFDELDNMKLRPASDSDYLFQECDSIVLKCIINCVCADCDKSPEKLTKEEFNLAVRDPVLFEILEIATLKTQ